MPTTTHHPLGAPVIDNLGFHTDRDLHAELATLDRELAGINARTTTGNFHSHEDRINTWSRQDSLQYRRTQLLEDIAQDDAETDRLLAAIRTVGDPDLGFIAYVVFGPAVLPIPALYEVRVIERDGYTVPGTVRRQVTADQVAATEQDLLDDVLKPNGYAAAWGHVRRDYRTQVTAY
ncbi:hypothetical protein AB0G98_21500 [Streptomyces sp. NPDC020196]|uniref:hypothetical protein n=1 Tax=Streptomyces sp. NPDC020196 TaxID=3156656 RepID=UPI0033E5AA4F